MEKFLLWTLFVLSLVLAFGMLNSAQDLEISPENFRNLMAGGSFAAIFALASGWGLALEYQ
jgi:hypothetical protein